VASSTTWVAANADGRLEVFAAGFNIVGDWALWHQWQTAASNGWSNWSSFGTPAGVSELLSLTVGTNADGRLEVFVAGIDNALWHLWQTAPSNGWSDWSSFGAPGGELIGSPAVAANADGRLEVFVVAGDDTSGGELWHQWQTAPNNGWSGWSSFATPGINFRGTAAVAANADGRLEVFVVDIDGALWHQWQTAPNNGWSDWSSFGTAPEQGSTFVPFPVVAPSADGRLELFCVDDTVNGALWHQWQTAPSNGWSGWSSALLNPPGVPLNVPAVAPSADGSLHLFVVGTDEQLWQLSQTAPSNGWSGWSVAGNPPGNPPGVTGLSGRPALGLNKDGRLEVVVVGNDGVSWHQWQTAANNGWAPWSSLGNPPEYQLEMI
jgi:hypothetical protein